MKTMPKVGDRVIIEGTKVGAQRREGSLVGVVGSLMRIRWTDGSESMLSPAAGSIRFEPTAGGSARAPKPAARAAQAKKPAAKPAKNVAKKKR
jgi:hypothetical protein